jgi:methionyl-tRNA formyltransferase
MRIAVVSNTDALIPVVYTMASQGLVVDLFLSPSPDSFTNQKIKAFTEQVSIHLTEEKNVSTALYEWLSATQYDVCFVLGYAHLIDLGKIKTPVKLYNIHFGPLPSFRGPVPVFWQLKQGSDLIGLTIHEVSQKFDSGNIVWIKETPNLPHYNYEIVNQLFGQLCVEGVFHILRFYMNKSLPPVINGEHGKMNYHKRPGLADVSIEWNTMPAATICNLIRACNPWNKGAATNFKTREVKLMDACVVESNNTLSGAIIAGTIVNDSECLEVICCDGKIIKINMLFFENGFIPTYQSALFGFVKGEKFE